MSHRSHYYAGLHRLAEDLRALKGEDQDEGDVMLDLASTLDLRVKVMDAKSAGQRTPLERDLIEVIKPLLGFAATYDGNGAQAGEAAWADEAYADLKGLLKKARDVLQRAEVA